jgi:hypothetical protein
MSTKTWISTLAAVFVFLTAIFAATRDFAGLSFQGSSLTGWHTLGPASWRTRAGRSSRHRTPDDGWLMMTKVTRTSSSIPTLRRQMRCRRSAACGKRRPTAAGKSLRRASGEGGSFDLTLNADGKELSTEALPRAAAVRARPRARASDSERAAARPAITLAEQEEEAAKSPAAPAGRGRTRRPGRIRAAASGSGRGTVHADIIVDTDMVTTSLNGRRGGNSATNDRMMGYGPIALIGTGEIRFRDVALGLATRPNLSRGMVSAHSACRGRPGRHQSRRYPGRMLSRLLSGPDCAARVHRHRSYSAGNNFPEGSGSAYDYTGDAGPPSSASTRGRSSCT